MTKPKQICGLVTLVAAALATVFPATSVLADGALVENSSHQSRPLRTIIVDNYQPYTFMNDKGEPDGFSVAIARAVAKVMGSDLEIRPGLWEQAMEELQNGTIDLLPMMAYSAKRDKLFDFSVPHTIAYDAIFTKKGNISFRSIKDLSGKLVVVMNKDIAHEYLDVSGLLRTMNLLFVGSLPEALRQIASGKGDAAIMPKIVGIITAKKLNITDIDESPRVIEEYIRPFSFAVKKGDQKLLERLNQGLNIIKSTGEYGDIYNKWFGSFEEPQVDWSTVIIILSIIALAFICFIIWSILLRRQVKLKTRHLESEVFNHCGSIPRSLLRLVFVC